MCRELMGLMLYGARLSSDRDDPSRGVAARLNFHDRTHQSREERPAYSQGCLLAAMLVIAAAPRHFRVSRLERLHA